MRNPAHVDELIIEPGCSFRNYWTDLWRYRELFYILAWRDVAVRYKDGRRGGLGGAAAVHEHGDHDRDFGNIAGLPSEGGAPYAIMVFAAMLPWQFFPTRFLRE